MSVDAFAECYAGYVEVTVDSVINDLRTAGAENIQRFIDWWESLSPKSITLMQTLAASATAVLAVILTKLGAYISVFILALLAGASWALLVRALVHCQPVLWT
ncbi:hypothetical protein ACFWUU_05385 [Kribbella sp. NPDC058693]|uniref:hypothetical protein n=1 Tax=Kribbella sp. NPDC058693 TaxID=3346602 RepID=UPI0036579D30